MKLADEIARTRANSDEAARVLGLAVEAVQVCEAAVGAAKAAHVASPGDDGARIHAANDALTLAHVRLEAAKNGAAEASKALEGATAALEFERADQNKSELRRRADPGTLARAIATPWATARDAYAKFKEATGQIRDAYRDSIAASTELRSTGEYVQDLSRLHPVLPALEDAAAQGRGSNDLNNLAPTFDPQIDPAVEVFALLQRLDRLPSQPAQAEWVRRQVTMLGKCRTVGELDALEREHGKREQAAWAAAYVAPPLRQRARDQ